MKKLLVLMSLLAVGASAYSADKIGVVDVRKVFTGYKGYSTMMKSLNDKRDQAKKELDAKNKAIVNKQKELSGKKQVTDADKKAYENLIKDYENAAKSKQDALMAEEQKNMEQVQDKIVAATRKVRDAGGYDVIYDSGAVIVGGTEVTDEVIKEMNK